ncbi:MAG: tetratricopeptide repeat protein [Ignavibacterium sp.]|nr:tetratricopeptide repeat protein [Ignavibacterium sp.]
MKTLILLLAFIITFNSLSIAQRNPTKDRDKTIDRIDREKVENPVRNPEKKREPIQSPNREKINPPPTYLPSEPVVIEVVEIWKPIPGDCYPDPVSPIFYPDVPPIIDNPPSLEELSLTEVYELGIINLDTELFNEAIKCFNILLKDDPLNYELYCFRGRAYYGLELFDKAVKDYQKSIKIKKDYADGYYYLGLTEISIGNIDEAIVDFELASDFGNEKAKSLLKKYFKY